MSWNAERIYLEAYESPERGITMKRIGSVLAVAAFFLFTPFSPLATNRLFAEELTEYEEQDKAFEKWWGEKLEWNFSKLPLEGKVDESRIPYSGHDYPDRQGGTFRSLKKYDAAFRTGGQASAWERWDTTAYQEPIKKVTTGLFRRRVTRTRMGTPHWHGHCNGWTAAAMRHAEPVNNVVRNGVTFTPADIKGLLAEVYMYQDIEFLGGAGYGIDPATFHVVLTNWLGRGKHPVAMDSTLGKEVWNYPIYSYKATSRPYGANAVDVTMNFTYAQSTKQEMNKGPRLAKQLYMHYRLHLDNAGRITGGFFYNDSNQVDILWAQLAPVQGGQDGNKRGSPHVDVASVMSIWRDSVPKETRMSWLNINPLREDAVTLAGEEFADSMLPTQQFPPAPVAEETAETESSTTATESTETTTETAATSGE